MLTRLLCVLSLLLSFAAASAQPQPAIPSAATTAGPPPKLDAPNHWDVYNESGKMDLRIDVVYVGNDGISDVYYTTMTGTINGQPFTSWAMAYDETEGQTLRVYNGDSHRWTMWEWDIDHYDKIGGTSAKRSYYPKY